MRQALLLLAFVATSAWPATEFKNSDFELKLGSDWTRTVLIKNKLQDPYRAAQTLIERGIKRESDENKMGWATIIKQAVSRFRDGVMATYSGRELDWPS